MDFKTRWDISILAPLAGRDVPGAVGRGQRVISILAPLAGRDSSRSAARAKALEFQSSRPLRGATLWPRAITSGQNKFQSSRPLRGATLTVSQL